MQVLVLNASLKHGNELSNTEEVTNMVLDEMRKHGQVEAETIRLADKNIPVGLGFRESADDEWPEIADKLRKANMSSSRRRSGGAALEPDAARHRAHGCLRRGCPSGRSDLLNKVAGVVITGSEDGAQAVLAGIMEVLTFMNFTLPPAVLHLLGRRGRPRPEDRPRAPDEEQGGRRHGSEDRPQPHVLRASCSRSIRSGRMRQWRWRQAAPRRCPDRTPWLDVLLRLCLP